MPRPAWSSAQDMPACEGKAWWVQLQRQRTAGRGGAPANKAAACPAATSSPGSGRPASSPSPKGATAAALHSSQLELQGLSCRKSAGGRRSPPANELRPQQRKCLRPAGHAHGPAALSAIPATPARHESRAGGALIRGCAGSGGDDGQRGWRPAGSSEGRQLQEPAEGGPGRASGAPPTWHQQQQQAQAEHLQCGRWQQPPRQQQQQQQQHQEADGWHWAPSASAAEEGRSDPPSEAIRNGLEPQHDALHPEQPPAGSSNSSAALPFVAAADCEMPPHVLHLPEDGRSPPAGCTPPAGSSHPLQRRAGLSCPSSVPLLDRCSAEATAGSGGDVGRGTPDPLLAAWMVTRAPPALPVRGYSPPPGRTACRLLAAQEMME
jgi:hypothetical protein